MTRRNVTIEELTAGMILDTMAGPRRIVAIVNTDDAGCLVSVTSRPMGRGGACVTESWSHGTMMRTLVA